MIFRRDFLQLALAAGMGSVLPLPLCAGTTAATPASGLPLFRVIHDTRHPASLVQARQLGRQLLGEIRQADALLRAVHGDLTRFWYDELQPVWQQQRVAVAGTTAPDIVFCLEQLARDHQLRVLWREEQAAATGQPLVSWLIAAA